jgi:arylamine N-acetyltransferase
MDDPRDSACAVALFEERYGATSRRDSLGALTDLLVRFAHLPYENLSKILAWGNGAVSPMEARREPRRVMEDHLALGTGGTCFSLTELLRCVTRAAGLRCYPVMAHMRHGANIHCALRVEAGGRAYLVDPGYLVRTPLALTGRSPRCGDLQLGSALLVPAGSLDPPPLPAVPAGDFDLYTVEPEGPRWRYRFADRPVSEEEFLGHWHRSFLQPAMRALLASSRGEAGELLYLHNHKLRHQGTDGKRTTNVRADLDRRVAESFGIHPTVTRQAAALVAALRAPRRT